MLKAFSRRGRGLDKRQRSVASTIDQHGAALLSLGMAMTGDRRQAEAAVVETVCSAYSSSWTDRLSPTEVRQELAQQMYAQCGPQLSGSGGDEKLERIALALTRCGQLDYRRVAELLDVRATTVVQVLNSALRR